MPRYRYKPGKGGENTHFKVNGVRVSAGNVVELAEDAPIIASVNGSVDGELDQATGTRRPALVLIEEAPPPSERGAPRSTPARQSPGRPRGAHPRSLTCLAPTAADAPIDRVVPLPTSTRPPIELARPNTSALRALIEEREQLGTEAVEDLVQQLLDLAETIGARLEAALGGAPTGTTAIEISLDGLKEADKVRAAILATELQDIAELLDDAGLAGAREAWFERYEALADAAERTLGAQGVPAASRLLDGDAAAAAIRSMTTRHDAALFGGISQAASARILDALHQSAGLVSHTELAADIAEQEGLSAQNARTEAETRIAEADRFFQDESIKEAEGDDAGLFLRAYVGPVDGKTRAFCKHLVGKAFSDEQVDRMRNGQIGQPRYSGGGYRCRHTFIGVLEELLEDLGYSRGTDADVEAASAASPRRKRSRA